MALAQRALFPEKFFLQKSLFWPFLIHTRDLALCKRTSNMACRLASIFPFYLTAISLNTARLTKIVVKASRSEEGPIQTRIVRMWQKWPE